MKNFIIKCNEHFPGYEIGFAKNTQDAIIKLYKWKGCRLELFTFRWEKEDELEKEKYKRDKLKWFEEFKIKNPGKKSDPKTYS